MLKAKLSVFLFFLLVVLEVSAQSSLHADTSYYETGEVREIKTYKKRSLVNHLAFDKSGKLIYQSPLLPDQKVPTYRFASGRTYYDQRLTDTIVFERNIPYLNVRVYFPGATVMPIGHYSYFIKSWAPQPGTQKGKMVINVFENAFYKSKRVFNKVVYTDLK